MAQIRKLITYLKVQKQVYHTAVGRGNAASDISIAVILVFTLQRMKTNMRRTKKLVHFLVGDRG
ncbi:hypothetical protein AAF712_007045 [Marasmius tenuissimus]|uniref:Uncharacterized protein n=1 Tax=Marasmius tenuissimus TaxID=585030 RepID=A0ABR2ZYQ3_9AGAR